MSLIKENKFIVVLGSSTLAGAALILFYGAHGASKYQTAKDRFTQAQTESSEAEILDPYPTDKNRSGKKQAINVYSKSVAEIQSVFEPFRPKEIKNMNPQEFTTKLLAANTQIREAFKDSGTSFPDAFLVGFEGYRSTLARPDTTGVLEYQLGGITKILLELAKAKPTELKNLHRPLLPEEELKKYTPPENAAARPFPLEISFVGSEMSAREFLSSIAKPVSPYVVIRCLKIINEKKDPPRAADAQFDKAVAAKSNPAAGPAPSPFGGAFDFPPDAPGGKPGPTPPAPKAADSSKILSQVLGKEKVSVFIRLDILQFLPATKLP